jgi:hypothetical protein
MSFREPEAQSHSDGTVNFRSAETTCTVRATFLEHEQKIHSSHLGVILML